MSDTHIIDDDAIETTLDALGWYWLRDKHGWYRVNVEPDPEHGDLPTEYRFGIWRDPGNVLVIRLYGTVWFAGSPEAVLEACNAWNVDTPYPKAALIRDRDGDSRLLLEWAVALWDEPIPATLVAGWVDLIREGCAVFLSRYAKVIAEAPRFVPVPGSSAIH